MSEEKLVQVEEPIDDGADQEALKRLIELRKKRAQLIAGWRTARGNRSSFAHTKRKNPPASKSKSAAVQGSKSRMMSVPVRLDGLVGVKLRGRDAAGRNSAQLPYGRFEPAYYS